METGERIRQIRLTLGMTQQEFGEVFGFKWFKVRDIESGKQKVTPNLAQLIEKKFFFSSAWILFGHGSMRQTGSNIEVGGDQGGSRVEVHALSGKERPYELFSGPPLEYITLPERYVDETHIVKIHGKGMEPLICDGAIVGIGYDDSVIESGKIYALWLPTEGAIIRRIFCDANGLICKADNISYPDIYLPQDEVEVQKVILGRVRWVLQML